MFAAQETPWSLWDERTGSSANRKLGVTCEGRLAASTQEQQLSKLHIKLAFEVGKGHDRDHATSLKLCRAAASQSPQHLHTPVKQPAMRKLKSRHRLQAALQSCKGAESSPAASQIHQTAALPLLAP